MIEELFVLRKWAALYELINSKNVYQFSDLYHYLTDTNTTRLVPGLWNRINIPLKRKEVEKWEKQMKKSLTI